MTKPTTGVEMGVFLDSPILIGSKPCNGLLCT